MSLDEEVKFLARFVAEAKDPDTFSIAELKVELEKYYGKTSFDIHCLSIAQAPWLVKTGEAYKCGPHTRASVGEIG